MAQAQIVEAAIWARECKYTKEKSSGVKSISPRRDFAGIVIKIHTMNKRDKKNIKKSKIFFDKANIHLGSGELNKAHLNFKKSLEYYPDNPNTLNNVGIIHLLKGEPKEAHEAFRLALSVDSENYQIMTNIGRACHHLHKYSSAVDFYDRAIALKPNYAEAWCNKGVTLNTLGKFKDSLLCFDRAIENNQNYSGAFSNKGNALAELNMNEEAIEYFDKAIEIDNRNYNAKWNKSHIELLLGNFDSGWKLYDARWNKSNADPYRYPNITEVDSLENISGKNVLVWHEQGLGDTIQFARYVPLLVSRGAHITFQVQKLLEPLFQGQIDCRVVSRDIDTGEFDFQIPLLSLPRLFETTLDTIPDNTPYLRSNPDKVALWRSKLQLAEDKPNVGLAISGNPEQVRNHIRSISLESFEPLIDLAKFYLIQTDLTDSDQDYLEKRPDIIFLGDQLDDFADSAAVVENMDFVCSICTSLIHLAGALGKSAYLMSAWAPDWRWLLNRNDSPWYPSVEIIRQKSAGDWGSVIKELETRLQP